MRKLLWIFGFLALIAGGIPAPAGAAPAAGEKPPPGETSVVAQNNSREIAGALGRLKNNPRYRGRILGTHVVRNGPRYLYEVRILRPDDRIILVYIDPDTGGVVGDSERSGGSRASPQRERQNSNERRERRDWSDRRERRDWRDRQDRPRRSLTPEPDRRDRRPFWR